MSSKRDAILVSAVTALNAVGKPAGLSVHRQRTLPIGKDILPAQVVYAVDEEVNTGPGMGAGPTPQRKAKRTLKIAIESRVSGGSSPDAALDPLLSWAVQALCADPQIGGTVHDVKELGTLWSEADADEMYGAARQYFEVTYITSASNPDAAQ